MCFFRRAFVTAPVFPNFLALWEHSRRLLSKLDSYDGNPNEKYIVVLIPEIFSKIFIVNISELFTRTLYNFERMIQLKCIILPKCLLIFQIILLGSRSNIDSMHKHSRMYIFRYFILPGLEYKMYILRTYMKISLHIWFLWTIYTIQLSPLFNKPTHTHADISLLHMLVKMWRLFNLFMM